MTSLLLSITRKHFSIFANASELLENRENYMDSDVISRVIFSPPLPHTHWCVTRCERVAHIFTLLGVAMPTLLSLYVRLVVYNIHSISWSWISHLYKLTGVISRFPKKFSECLTLITIGLSSDTVGHCFQRVDLFRR